MPKLTLLCINPGSPDFPVNIDENETVDDLKKKIKEASAPAFDALRADMLTLYRTNVDISDDKDYHRIIDEISRGAYQFKPKDELVPSRLTSQFFQRNSGGTVEVLVELPPGDLIYSRSVVLSLRPIGQTQLDTNSSSASQGSKWYTYVCL